MVGIKDERTEALGKGAKVLANLKGPNVRGEIELTGR